MMMVMAIFQLALGSSMAQYATFNHDESVMNQVTIQETGSGSFCPDLYYDAFHKSYRNWAAEQNKLSFRTMTAASMKLQEPYAEKIDSDLVKRSRIEAENLLDREVDAAWLIEKGKLNTALEEFKGHIEQITLSGGNYRTYEDWKEVYEMEVAGVQYMQDGYMPNSERQEQYMQIYKDIKVQDKKLKKLLLILKQSKTPYWCNRTLRRKDALVKNTSLNSLSRWKSAAVQAMQKR